MTEKNGKSKQMFRIITFITVIYMVVYLVWRAFFTIPDIKHYGIIPFLFGIALFAAELLSSLEAFVHYRDLSTDAQPEMPKIPKEWYPDVDVLIATHNEDDDLLYKTINACMYLTYPDKKKVHVFVCDDGNRPSVKKMAEELGAGYFGIKDNKEAKAGNLNHAMSKTSSPLIATFDADMIPSSNFLMETVPYFFLPKMKQNDDGTWIVKSSDEIDPKEKIGFIQTPQSFYNPDLFQYNLYSEKSIPNEQDYFFREVNVGRNKSNSAIYAGSNTVIAREALEEVGGISTGTITEDFETGLRIEMNGWRCYAVDKLLAKGLAPTSIGGLIKQRERWARGCIFSLKRLHILINKNIPLRMKISYMACRSYWSSFLRRFVYILSPILFVLFGIPVVICDLKELLLIWFPAYVLYDFTLRNITGHIRSSRWSNIIDTIMFPYLIIPVCLETFWIHQSDFVVTSKQRNENEQKRDSVLMLPHLFLLILSVIALVLSLYDIISYQAYGGTVVAYWLCVNGISLLMAIFFMLGRKNVRQSERFAGDVQIQVECRGQWYQVHTIDISEGGFCVAADEALYLSYKAEEEMKIVLSTEQYEAHVKAVVTSVGNRQEDGYHYGFRITQMKPEDKREYMQIVFDRVHTLPKKIGRSSSVFGDVVLNVTGRTKKAQSSVRKLVRVDVNRTYPTEEGVDVYIRNFNFEYIRIDTETDREEFHVQLADGCILHCIRTTGGLYRIRNMEHIETSEVFQNILKEWNNVEE